MPEKPTIRTDRLLERFLRYVAVDTTANPNTQMYPSSQGQLDLGNTLVDELKQMGVEDVEQDEHGLVWATIPATVAGQVPTILFNAHLDTSPEAPGANVNPRVIEDYQGGDIPLEKNSQIIRVETCEALNDLKEHTLVTTDGSTLLGGDDKAGVAAIMELSQHLIENPHLPHGPVKILFTCDEEVGRGASHMDIPRSNASAGYTLDGSGQGIVENENFSADHVIVKAIGNNIHPSIGKGRMTNALRGLSMLIADLPLENLSPESTDSKEGFLHPYSMTGSVAEAQVEILLRDFQTERLDDYEKRIRSSAEKITEQIPQLKFEIVRQRQYRNMADALLKSPHVVELATSAFEQLGYPTCLGSIRGGTDGAVFSEMGLPTPNLSVGQHNIHSVLEFVSLDEMAVAVQHAVCLLDMWQQEARS